jgi:hypothetical protein
MASKKRCARPARGKAGKVTVVDVARDGTGPWKVFVGEYGIAQFPSEASNDDPKSYAKEVARVIRNALKDPRFGPLQHKREGETT